jgi:hypothetical protein
MFLYGNIIIETKQQHNNMEVIIMMAKNVMDKVVAYINEVREKYPEITNDMLLEDGKIHYMNGNDGTDFDWGANEMTCEFMVFYKETEYGFIKVNVYKDDTISGYVYLEKGFGVPIKLEPEELDDKEALHLASLLYLQADKKDIYDETIDKIDFDRKLEWYELLENEEDEDEEDYWYEDEEEEEDEDWE